MEPTDVITTKSGLTATLYLADCLEVLPTLERVDCLVTDPPYSSGGMVRGDRMASTRSKYQSSDVDVEHPDFTGDNRDQRGFHAWAALWLAIVRQKMPGGAVVALFSDWRQLPTMTDAIQSGGFVWRGIVPWDKTAARPMPNRFRSQCEFLCWGTQGARDFSTDGAKYHPGILVGKPPSSGREHSTQKPEDVLQTICDIAPTGGYILDPFVGSGTTGVAALRMGCNFIGVEIEPKYYAIAKRRIQAEAAQGKLF